jgi:hypothetical protein
MIYGLGSKAVDIQDLLGQHGDQDSDDDENTNSHADDTDYDAGDDALLTAVDELSSNPEFENEEDADSVVAEEDEDYDTQVPAIAAPIPTRITTTSLAKYRRDGPFGKLHAIGVLFRKSSQLKDAFNAAQQAVTPGQPPLAWIHNVATHWSSDFAMAERALRLKRALNRLIIDIEDQWHDRGSVQSQRPEILSYKLKPSEWKIVKSLLHILKQFTIATDRLQGDPSMGSQTTGCFDEFLPTVELLLDHLETAVNGWTIDMSPEAADEGFQFVNIFEGLHGPCHGRQAQAV